MTFDAGASVWIAAQGASETRYRFTAGSFTLGVQDGEYSLQGKLSAETMDFSFSYKGTLAFENLSKDDIDPNAIYCQGCYGTYYGKYYVPEAHSYYMVVYDTKHASPGDPYNYRIALDFNGTKPAGNAIMPETGIYEIADDLYFDEGTAIPGHLNADMGIDGTQWSIPNQSGQGSTLYPATAGRFTLTKITGGYRVSGKLEDGRGNSISFLYEGPLAFDDQSQDAPITDLAANKEFGSLYYARTWLSQQAETQSLWKVFLYSEDSWTSQGERGDYVEIDLVLEPDARKIPAGTYEASPVNRPQTGRFLPGYVYTRSYAYGSWLISGQTTTVAPLKGGSVTFTSVGEEYRVWFDFTDDAATPNRIRGSYEGPIVVVQKSAGPALRSGGSPALTDGNSR